MTRYYINAYVSETNKYVGTMSTVCKDGSTAFARAQKRFESKCPKGMNLRFATVSSVRVK